MMTFIQRGKQIRKFRVERGYSQQVLAEKIGVTWEMVSRYERGRSSPLQKIMEIADALGIAPSVFFEPSSAVSEFKDSAVTYQAEPPVVPMLTMLPQNPDDLAREVKRTPYFYGLSLPVINSFEKSKVFCLDLQKIANLKIQVDEINQRGFLLLTFPEKNVASEEAKIYLIHKNGQYLLVKGTRDLPNSKVVGKGIEYTIMF